MAIYVTLDGKTLALADMNRLSNKSYGLSLPRFISPYSRVDGQQQKWGPKVHTCKLNIKKNIQLFPSKNQTLLAIPIQIQITFAGCSMDNFKMANLSE